MHHRLTERVAFAVLGVAAACVIVPVLLMIGLIVKEGVGALSWEFLTTAPRAGMREGGIFPAIVGTCYLVIGAVVFAVPFGVIAAVYLTEYARKNAFTRVVGLAIINLSGVPSVVYGLFGLGLFVIFLRCGSSIVAGSLTLAIMNLPVVVTATREALRNVPQSFREASLALGVSRLQTIRHVVLPNAVPGILTGIILEVGRAAGETAPILFTAAAFYLPQLPRSIFDQVMALPTHLFAISTQIPNIGLQVRYGTALVLVALVLVMNAAAIFLRAQIRRRQRW